VKKKKAKAEKKKKAIGKGAKKGQMKVRKEKTGYSTEIIE